MKFILKSDVS